MMVGHFLHPHRKSRNSNSNNNNNTSSSNSNRTSSDSAAGSSSSSSFLPSQIPFVPPQNLTAEAVAALPPPGLSGPSSLVFSPKQKDDPTIKYLVFVSTSPKTTSSRRLRGGDSSSSTATFSTTTNERQLCSLDLHNYSLQPLLRLPSKRRFDAETAMLTQQQHQLQTQHHLQHQHQQPQQQSSNNSSSTEVSEERLRRERQRLHSSGGLTQFSWCWHNQTLRLLVPIRGSLYIQDGMDSHLKMVYDKHSLDTSLATPPSIGTSSTSTSSSSSSSSPSAALDPQLSPDGSMVAFCVLGEIFVSPGGQLASPIQITYGANVAEGITHGIADFVAQEEMDRYRGYWWSPDSKGILITRVDESQVPPYRIPHHEDVIFEDHRYPFAGKANPKVKLAYVPVDIERFHNLSSSASNISPPMDQLQLLQRETSDNAKRNWEQRTIWFDPPREAPEYLARVSWFPDGTACAQWQNRSQTCLLLSRMNVQAGTSHTLLVERSDVWINLHHMLHVLDRPIPPPEAKPNSSSDVNMLDPLAGLAATQNTSATSATTITTSQLSATTTSSSTSSLPPGSFSFLFASERTGFCHLYLYTYIPGRNQNFAMLVRPISSGPWVVESIAGVDQKNNTVYVTGTFDSVLERHLYALPLTEDAASTPPLPHTPATSPNPNGVRRSFKHVMNAFTGKSSSSSFAHGNSSNSNTASSSLTPDSSTNASGATPTTTTIPVRLTQTNGMHQIVMDADCTMFVDTYSSIGRPTCVQLFQAIPPKEFYAVANGTIMKAPVGESRLLYTLYDAIHDDKSIDASRWNDPASAHIWNHNNNTSSNNNSNNSGGNSNSGNSSNSGIPSALQYHLQPPELLTVPSSDGTETLQAALYRPDARIHGPGPYPLICAVYGGPHVQRVQNSWSQSADMRAQRLRSLGFCVVKCDNRGSSRRGLAFESAIARRLGRLEVLDQVAVVRHLTSVRGIADPNRVGIYGWSYGGYLSAMCLCRAPDVFHVAVAGAPVTSWDGYDTHYTERYMGLPCENMNGYRESAVLDHVPNMRGKLLLVHGLIDENVHFRHTARLINRLIAAGKDYDLLLFPDERHSPRRLRDRIYMEQRISDYFVQHLGSPHVQQQRHRGTAGMAGL